MYTDMTLFAILTGVVVPLLVGVLTKIDAPAGLKAIVNFALTAAGTALATANEVDWDWTVFAVNFAIGWAISIATYYGLYKPTGVAPAVQEATAGFGIG